MKIPKSLIILPQERPVVNRVAQLFKLTLLLDNLHGKKLRKSRSFLLYVKYSLHFLRIFVEKQLNSCEEHGVSLRGLIVPQAQQNVGTQVQYAAYLPKLLNVRLLYITLYL